MVLYRTERIQEVLLRGRIGCLAVAVGVALLTAVRRPTGAASLRRARAPASTASALSGPCQIDHAVAEIGRAG